MKLRSLIIGAAIILIANAFALVHVAMNRLGPPDSVIALTKLELRYGYAPPSDDDSGVTLYLNWADTYNLGNFRWLDRQKLRQLGFRSEAPQTNRWQRPRPAFVAVEYSGPAWQALHDDFERNRAARKAKNETVFPEYDSASSHLVAIDADLNASTLRTRPPDGASVLIVPALIYLYVNDKSPTGFGGSIQQLNSAIHVPRPFSDQFRGLKQPMPPYKVQLHFGAFHEPWVTGVEIP